MLSKTQLKFIRSLHLAKFRKHHKLFIAEGPKVVEELMHSTFRIKTLLAVDSWIEASHGKPVSPETELISITKKELERISTLQTPNEVMAVIQMKSPAQGIPYPENELILALDGIRDPGNFGTILRTADWFGLSAVVCSTDCVDVYNPKVIQATMGSIARVNVSYQNLTALFTSAPAGLSIYGALLEGRNIFEEDLSRKGYLVVGSESHGISRGLLPFITHPVAIPSSGNRAESLNASVATAILCAEFSRRNKK